MVESGCGPRSEKAGAYGSSSLKFLRTLQTDFYMTVLICTPPTDE